MIENYEDNAFKLILIHVSVRKCNPYWIVCKSCSTSWFLIWNKSQTGIYVDDIYLSSMWRSRLHCCVKRAFKQTHIVGWTQTSVLHLELASKENLRFVFGAGRASPDWGSGFISPSIFLHGPLENMHIHNA